MQTRSTEDSLNLSKLFKRLPIATAVAGAIAYLPAHQASAQEQEAVIEEITITGSRITRDGYDLSLIHI